VNFQEHLTAVCMQAEVVDLEDIILPGTAGGTGGTGGGGAGLQENQEQVLQAQLTRAVVVVADLLMIVLLNQVHGGNRWLRNRNSKRIKQSIRKIWSLDEQLENLEAGTWPKRTANIDYMVVAGGGSGGTCVSSSAAGGGGAGGYQSFWLWSSTITRRQHKN
jgi:hypothetical protein